MGMVRETAARRSGHSGRSGGIQADGTDRTHTKGGAQTGVIVVVCPLPRLCISSLSDIFWAEAKDL